jgi:putative transposase
MFSGTTMGAVHILPGSTSSNVAEKGDYPSEKTSALTLVELERWLALQVGGVYHQTVYSSLLKPPAAAWQDGLARRRQAPRKPADPPNLSPLAGRSSKPVLIKYDPRNLSRVFYRDKNGHYWPIPYRNLGAPPISLWEQCEAMKRLRSEGRRLVDERLIFETALAQRRSLNPSRSGSW